MSEAAATTSTLSVPGGTRTERFLGRAEELALIRQMLVQDGVRLLTLTGPGGVGKTTLALEAARELRAAFPDGIWFVDLTATREPSAVPTALAQSLGLRDAGSVPLLDQMSAYLDVRESLLVLDNFEQVLLAAPFLDALLAVSPGLRLLVTSRELLHLRSEHILPVLPFALPDPDHLPSLETLAQIPSVALFVQRARMLNPRFRLTAENAQAIAELCVRLDGLPLAIELAAVRTPLLSPRMLLERLALRLSLLHWDAQDLPGRQHTLRAAIAWSYDLLTEEEQVLFRCLGVFVDGFTLEAAEAIGAVVPGQTIEVLETLASLVEKSLVVREEDGDEEYRFRLLESMHDFALEQAVSLEEVEAIGRAHAWYFVELSERAAPALVGPAQTTWFLRLERDYENLRSALRWLLENDENEPALRLAAALGYFWEVRGYLREGQRALEETLARAPDADPRLRARALNRLASILIWQGEMEHSRVALDEAVAVGRALGDADITARSLTQLGRQVVMSGCPKEDVPDAVQHLEEALALREQVKDRRGAAVIRTQLAWLALSQQAYEEATGLGQEALAVYREVGDVAGGTVPLVLLGLIAGRQGHTARAVSLMREALEAVCHLQDRRLLLLLANRALSWLAPEQGDPELLAILRGATETLGAAIESAMSSEWSAIPAAALQARLGKERFDAARRKGRPLSLEQISDVIARVLDKVEAATIGAEEAMGAQPTMLSPREEEMLHLIAEGLSNKQIARRLILSENTVKTHVTSLFNKLGVDSRARAVAVAAQHDLL